MEKVFQFFRFCLECDPEEFGEIDESECVVRAAKICHTNMAAGLTPVLTEIVHNYLLMFMARDRHRIIKPTPDLPILPEKMRNSSPSPKNKLIVSRHYEEVENILGHAFVGNLFRKGCLKKAECPECDGYCEVQRAKFIDLFVKDEPYLIVPCVSEASKKLPVYEVVVDHAVVSGTFSFSMWNE